MNIKFSIAIITLLCVGCECHSGNYYAPLKGGVGNGLPKYERDKCRPVTRSEIDKLIEKSIRAGDKKGGRLHMSGKDGMAM